MSSSSYISQSAAPSGPGSSTTTTTRDGNNNFMNGGDNLLKLALKKPKAWKWELTTSSSSPSISFPKIQLFDSRTGELMVQVDKPDCVVKSEELLSGGDVSERSRSSQERKGRDQRYRRSQSTCVREKVATSSEFLSDVFAQLQNKGMGHKLATSVTQYRVEDVEEGEVEAGGFGLQKSQSAREIRRSASVEQKRKILKSPSSRSGSILGRISECYRSSTEEEPPRQPEPPPPAPEPAPTIPEVSVVEEPEPKPTPEEENKNKIYKLVRSNVGTLIVREESFHTQRSLRRRRQDLQQQQSIPENEPQVDKRITASDIPDSSYNDTIKEIDNLISKVMLSHNLQDVQESPRSSRGRSSTQQNGGSDPVRKRRSRRSASAGSNASSCRSSAGSRRGRNSPLVTAPAGSSSSDEDLVALAESRFGSLKRRGRAKYKRNSTGQVNEVYGNGLANGGSSGKQHESNVRRSSTTVSSTTTNSTSVEIEECESYSLLSSFRSSESTKKQQHQAAIVQRSSEKSSSTSLSTLSPPSPAAEPCAAEVRRSSRWGTHEAETLIRDRERLISVDDTLVKSCVRNDDLESKMELSAASYEVVKKVEESISQRNTDLYNGKKVTVSPTAMDELSNGRIEESMKNHVNDYDCDIQKLPATAKVKPVTEVNEISKMQNGCDEAKFHSRDRERSNHDEPVKIETNDSTSKKLDEEYSSRRLQRISTKDCKDFPSRDVLSVRSPGRSPITTPSFGSFQFPRHIDGSGASSASLAWSYLPQLATSHSTSSLSSLRSNSSTAATVTSTSQSPVQRRLQKSYAQRHHRSSFHALPN